MRLHHDTPHQTPRQTPRRRTAALAVAVASALVAGLSVAGGLFAPANAATLANGGLEQGTVAPWVGTGPTWPALSVVSTPVHSGTRALKVTLPVMAAGSHTGACYPTTLTPGVAYTLSAWVRGGVTAQLRVNSTTRTQVAPAGNTWTRLTSTWTQGSTSGNRVCVVSEAAATTGGKLLWVDDATLTAATSPTPTPTPTSPTPTPTLPTGSSGSVTKLLTFVEENHSLAEMQSAMPYTNSLALQYGYATSYSAVTHPSLPNYLAIAGGSTFGVTDDGPPSAHPLDSQSVFGQARAAGKTAAVYADGMPTSCALSNGGTSYAVKHNPWAYFTPAAERSGCASFDVPESRLQSDITNGTLPNAGMVIPNLCNDAHDCPLSTADDWFKTRMQAIMAGPDWQSGHLAVVLTADEDDTTAGNKVLTVVIHPSQSRHAVSTPLTHYSLTRLYEQVIGTSTYLNNAATAPDMAAAFQLPVGAAPTSTPAPTSTASPTSTPTSTPTSSPSTSPTTGPTIGTLPVLHAVNKAGTEYACSQGWGFFDGPHDQALVTTMRSWGINAVRVPLNEDCWLGINGSPAAYSGASYRTAIKGWTDLLRANGMYVILDLHWSAPGGTLPTGQAQMADMDHSTAFWSDVASTYKSDSAGVLFDLFNEPFGITWAQWKSGDSTWAGMDDLIAAVRATGATNWVIANGLQWGNDLSGWLADKPADPANRLVAGAHVYSFNACVSATCWDKNYKPVAAQVPFLITEMGEDDCLAGFVGTLFAWSDANGGDGYSPWAFNSAYSCSGGPGLVSDNAGTPTAYGAGVRQYFLDHRV